jgi:hypothetical protein
MGKGTAFISKSGITSATPKTVPDAPVLELRNWSVAIKLQGRPTPREQLDAVCHLAPDLLRGGIDPF